MPVATWNGVVLAESDDTVIVEGNHYFPPESLDRRYFLESSHTSFCPWKGTAEYFTIIVDGVENPNSAWFYRAPKEAASEIAGRVAFWRGVRVDA